MKLKRPSVRSVTIVGLSILAIAIMILRLLKQITIDDSMATMVISIVVSSMSMLLLTQKSSQVKEVTRETEEGIIYRCSNPDCRKTFYTPYVIVDLKTGKRDDVCPHCNSSFREHKADKNRMKKIELGMKIIDGISALKTGKIQDTEFDRILVEIGNEVDKIGD